MIVDPTLSNPPLTGETLASVDVTPRTYGTDCAVFDFGKREFIDISSSAGSEKNIPNQNASTDDNCSLLELS